jgi:predicted small secreted protein
VLQVTDVRIHKEPKEVDGSWVQMSRYTYEKGETKEIP